MDESKEFIARVYSILDREQTELFNTQREHHKSWDTHILTLSTAALGFSFGFLPYKNTELICLAILGWLCFLLAIIFATSNYLFADRGIYFSLKLNSERRKDHDRVRRGLAKFEKSKAILEEKQEHEQLRELQDNFWKEVNEIYDIEQEDKNLKKINFINLVIRILNHLKTYAFLLGSIFITIYTFVNIEKLST